MVILFRLLVLLVLFPSHDNQGLVFNIANLRAAYALDKLYRISIAAGDGDYGSQIKAH